MLEVNITAAIVSLLIIYFVNCKFILSALWNKKLFKLFALRDRLAMLAMKREIDEDSEEYETLMRLLNTALKETRHFEVMTFIRFLREFKEDKNLQKKLDEIFARIEKSGGEYKKIFYGFYWALGDILHTQTRALSGILSVILHILNLVKLLPQLKPHLQDRQDELFSLGEDFERRKKELRPAHAPI